MNGQNLKLNYVLVNFLLVSDGRIVILMSVLENMYKVYKNSIWVKIVMNNAF